MTPVNLSKLRDGLRQIDAMHSRGQVVYLVAGEPLLAAARLFLAERENGQKVDWCAIHNQTAMDYVGSRAVGCPSNVVFGDCRMVEAWLTVEGSE